MTTWTTTPDPVSGAHPGTRAGGAGGPAAPSEGRLPGRGRLLPGGSPSGVLEHLALAALVFIPLLVVERGVVSSDTKTYLYIDPSRFLGQVASMWYPTVALGTVTHQYIGYLFPMGPYYALTAAVHLPTWVAQRVWLGAILLAAGAGILYLCRTFGLRGPGRVVAALAFMWSPYILQYSGRISVILMPWAALPWLVAFTERALRAYRGRETPQRWRYPAFFALVVALSAGINASSVLYVVLGPLLWLVWTVAVEHEARWRDAAAVLVRIGALSLLVSAWWIAGLLVEAGYGVDVLRYTESVRATSSTSTPLEVLRGLGYWYFYGGGKSGPWTKSVILYTRWVWLVAATYLVPVLAFLSAVVVRWRHRGYFVALTVVGVVLSVGAYPYTNPTAAGASLKAFMNDTTAGLAMRSTDRATPLALLGLALLLGAGVSAAWRRRVWAGWAGAGLTCALVLAANPALFNGEAAVDPGLTQPSTLPSYDLAAARYLDSGHPSTRVLAVPGNAFAAYTWGNTTDTPQPGLLDRPFVTREQLVMGSMATADTLYAMDEPVQTHVEDWAALAPMARLMSAGDVLVEYDQTSARYGSPQAVTLAQALARTPPGLALARRFGSPGERVAKPTVDTQLLAGTPHATKPAPVAVYRVDSPRPIVRAESDTGAFVVAGDATGLETLAAQGLLDNKSAIYYAGTLDSQPARLRRLAAGGATLVVTDSNRKQSFRWNGLSADAGQIETLTNNKTTRTPTSSPIDLFSKATDPTAASGSRTVATYVGAADVTASSYGNPVTFNPEDRAYSAIDGDFRTAWETGTFVADVDGQWWQADFGHQVSTDHVTLVQPLFGTRKRSISEVTLTFTGKSPVTVHLGTASRRRAGQLVHFATRAFRTLRITIDATTSGHGSPVGFAEVEVPGQHVTEIDRMPTDLLSRLGASSLRDRLVIAMTRTRVSPYTTARTDPQMILARSFTLPTARTFALSGTATLSPFLGDDEIDALVGVPGATGSGVIATSSSRLTGALGDTAGAAADGNTSTLWQPGFGAHDVVGGWVQYRLHSPITFDHLSLVVVADRRHSVPSALKVTATTAQTGRSETRHVTLPVILRSVVAGTTLRVPVSFPAVTGTRIRVTFTGALKKRGTLAFGTRTEVLPLGIAEIGIPGLRVPTPPARLPGTCVRDLLRLDGRPVTVKVVGSTATALADGQVSLDPCGADAGGIHLSAGHHVIVSELATLPIGATPPAKTAARRAAAVPAVPGWNVDRLTLTSPDAGGPRGGRAAGRAPAVRAHETSATAWTVGVRHATAPFELVLGESINSGWQAVATPGPGSPAGARSVTLGPPQLVDAFANGWQVSGADLSALGSDFTVSLTWAPQRWAWTGITISAASILGCIALAVVPLRRRRRDRDRGSAEGREELTTRADRGTAASPEPSISLPVRTLGTGRFRWSVVAGVAVLTGALGAAISAPYVGIALAISVAAGLTFRRLRFIGAVCAVALLVAAAAIVVVGQAVNPPAAGGNWPASYNDAAVLAAMAVAFLGADAVVDYATASDPRGSG
jgi:arabinofuranan 3-O-arabinosyltransferase